MYETIQTENQSIERLAYGEKEPYSRSNVQRRLAEISKQELKEEPRKRPGEDLKPWDTMILGKFGYKTWEDVPSGDREERYIG